MHETLKPAAVTCSSLAQADQFESIQQHLTGAQPSKTDQIRPWCMNHSPTVNLQLTDALADDQWCQGRFPALPCPDHRPAYVDRHIGPAERHDQVNPEQLTGTKHHGRSPRSTSSDVKPGGATRLLVEHRRLLTRPQHDGRTREVAPPHHRTRHTSADERISSVQLIGCTALPLDVQRSHSLHHAR